MWVSIRCVNVWATYRNENYIVFFFFFSSRWWSSTVYMSLERNVFPTYCCCYCLISFWCVEMYRHIVHLHIFISHHLISFFFFIFISFFCRCCCFYCCSNGIKYKIFIHIYMAFNTRLDQTHQKRKAAHKSVCFN
jgi:hypothetical protein